MSLDLQMSADEEQYQESGTERVFSAPQCVFNKPCCNHSSQMKLWKGKFWHLGSEQIWTHAAFKQFSSFKDKALMKLILGFCSFCFS